LSGGKKCALLLGEITLIKKGGAKYSDRTVLMVELCMHIDTNSVVVFEQNSKVHNIFAGWAALIMNYTFTFKGSSKVIIKYKININKYSIHTMYY